MMLPPITVPVSEEAARDCGVELSPAAPELSALGAPEGVVPCAGLPMVIERLCEPKELEFCENELPDVVPEEKVLPELPNGEAEDVEELPPKVVADWPVKFTMLLC